MNPPDADTRPSIVIDCDPGIDDAVALLLAFASAEAVRLEAISTTHGNVPLEATARNAARVRALAGRDAVPIYRGCPRPMTAAPLNAAHVHGADGLGGVELDQGAVGFAPTHGVDALISAGAGGRTVVAVGPLTNVAVALVKRPDIAGTLGRLVVMGGCIDGGNVTPTAEFNTFTDPEAARAVLANTDWPADRRPVLFPLDATRQAVADSRWIAELGTTGGPIASAAAGMLEFYERAVKGRQYGGVVIHDAMAVAWTIRPDLFETRPARLDVLTDSGAARGRTVADYKSGEPNADIVTAVDAPAFLDWLMQRLVSLDA